MQVGIKQEFLQAESPSQTRNQLVINVMSEWSGYFSIRHKTEKNYLFQSLTQET